MEHLTQIKDRLAGMTSEVEEMHPLLDVLFSQMPGIDRVEYTHGTGEMGADFVLTRAHPVLRTTQYIGVIAKIGKIHQNLAAIDRQIQECLTVERFIEGGKKRINLTEVWIIATQTITGGAERKINAAHAGSSIFFVSGADLAKLVDECSPHYWADLPPAIANYLSETAADAKDAEARTDLVQLDGGSFYIEQDLIRVELDPYRPGKTPRRSTTQVDFFEELSEHDMILVEAGMGGGKSKLVRRTVIDLADPSTFSDRSWMPVHATYKSFLGEHNGSLQSLLDNTVPDDTRALLPKNSQFVFLIDALDEQDESQEMLIQRFRDLRRQVDDAHNFRLVMTSRHINSVEFDKAFLGNVGRYEIRPLHVGRIAAYLEQICAKLNLATRLVDDIRRSPLFAKLPQSPLAAILLGQILRENPQELPSTIPELYSKYMELALGRWDMRKGLQSQQEYEAVIAVLSGLAEFMLEHSLEEIGVREFYERVRAYLSERNLRVEADQLAGNILDRSDVLVTSRGGHTVMFKHRSFAEFLYARRLVQTGSLEPSLRAFELYWGNVFYFGCGLLKDSPELLLGLSELTPTEEQHRWLKPLNLANFAMAAYVTPYPAIQDVVYTAVVEMASLFRDIAEGVVRSHFSAFSRMDLLWMVQMMIRDHYGFEFMSKALEYAALRALDESDPEVRPYVLFLLSVAFVDASSEGSFDYLLEDYESALPIDVSLAVWHEGEQRKGRSKLLKRHRQKLRRKLKGNAKLSHDIGQLYEVPVMRLHAVTEDEDDL